MAPTPLPTEAENPWPAFDITSCPGDAEDQPKSSRLEPLPSGLPPLILGCATFSQIYVSEDAMKSTMPLRVTRLALRYGINAFDTSPSYHPSELILGQSLIALRKEFPRSSYKLITKCGKYGPKKEHHMIEPDMLRKSIERSLRRFDTDYLDTVYIHDVEYTACLPCPVGDHSVALTSKREEYGLADGDEGKIRGEGDEKVLRALKCLSELKAEGKIRMIGISAYALPTLLRLSILALHHGTPLDMIQTYSHQNLQNSTLELFLPHFHDRAKLKHVANASPLNMGMLTTRGMPAWHPARRVPQLVKGTEEALRVAEGQGAKIEDAAVRFGMRDLRGCEKYARPPVVVGCADLSQVHAAVASYKAIVQDGGGPNDPQNRKVEEAIEAAYREAGAKNLGWEDGWC